MAASGIAIHDDVVNTYQSLKQKKLNAQYALFKFSKGEKEIIVDKVGDRDCSYEEFVKVLADAGPAYAVYDFEYQTKSDMTKRCLFFITWCPEGTPIKMKMILSSSKDALKRKLEGYAYELQANDFDDLSAECFRDKIKDCKRS